MECPECGYILATFDKECLRCNRNNATSKNVAASIQAPSPEPDKLLPPLPENFPTPTHAGELEEVSIEKEDFAPAETHRKSRLPVLALVLALVFVAGVIFVIPQITASTHSGPNTALSFLPESVRPPAVISFAAVSTESKAAYSDTTFENVTRFRIVQPGNIETDEGSGWKTYLAAPKGEQPIAISAARTMVKMSFSTTTWIKVHVLLLTDSGNIYDSEDGADWTLFMASDGKKAVGLAAASYAEKAGYSDTTYWHIEALRLLSDGSIESTEGDTWKLFAPADGKRVLSISAASTKEKASYSDTTLWTVNVLRLFADGNVEQSTDGTTWSAVGTHPEAVSVGAYNIEEKASYSDTTWENLKVDYVSADPAAPTNVSDQPSSPSTLSPSATLPPAVSPAPPIAVVSPPDTKPAAQPPAFEMKTKAGGGAPPNVDQFKH